MNFLPLLLPPLINGAKYDESNLLLDQENYDKEKEPEKESIPESIGDDDFDDDDFDEDDEDDFED